MTVRLANDIGMTPVNAYAKRFGIYDETKPELAWALGAGETTLLRLGLGRPMGGKTGTTNDSLDTWFMGFSPDLVAGVYVGMDTPEQMGIETGSSAASHSRGQRL